MNDCVICLLILIMIVFIIYCDDNVQKNKFDFIGFKVRQLYIH